MLDRNAVCRRCKNTVIVSEYPFFWCEECGREYSSDEVDFVD